MALQCKYVAVDASQALAAIFQQLLERDPGNADVAVAWARILRAPPLEQAEEGCDVLERAASASWRLGRFLRLCRLSTLRETHTEEVCERQTDRGLLWSSVSFDLRLSLSMDLNWGWHEARGSCMCRCSGGVLCQPGGLEAATI